MTKNDWLAAVSHGPCALPRSSSQANTIGAQVSTTRLYSDSNRVGSRLKDLHKLSQAQTQTFTKIGSISTLHSIEIQKTSVSTPLHCTDPTTKMASRLSKLEAEKLSIIQKSMSSRGRSNSPGGNNSRSSSALADDFNNREMKWSIINHDPLERIQGETATDSKAAEGFWEDENSEEEHISDDQDGEKFEYNGTGNILPNYACHDDKMTEISSILEHSNLNDQETIKKLEMLTASERAVANARNIGSNVDNDVVARLTEDKQALTGQDKLDFTNSDQDAETRRQKLEAYQAYRRKIIHQENDNLRAQGSLSAKKTEEAATPLRPKVPRVRSS